MMANNQLYFAQSQNYAGVAPNAAIRNQAATAPGKHMNNRQLMM